MPIPLPLPLPLLPLLPLPLLSPLSPLPFPPEFPDPPSQRRCQPLAGAQGGGGLLQLPGSVQTSPVDGFTSEDGFPFDDPGVATNGSTMILVGIICVPLSSRFPST